MTIRTAGPLPQILSNSRVAIATTAVLSGALAIVAFDMLGQFVSPLLKGLASPWLGAKLAPVPLANAVLSNLLGVPGKVVSGLGLGYGLHLITGLVLYPLAYMFLVRPTQQLLFAAPWWLAGTLYGIGLWIFALYFAAHLIAGNPPFLGWNSITWVALWSHILFGVVIAGVVWRRHEKD